MEINIEIEIKNQKETKKLQEVKKVKKEKKHTEEVELATAFQPIQIIANLEAVHLETTVGGILSGRHQNFRCGDTVVADEVRWEGNVRAAFNV